MRESERVVLGLVTLPNLSRDGLILWWGRARARRGRDRGREGGTGRERGRGAGGYYGTQVQDVEICKRVAVVPLSMSVERTHAEALAKGGMFLFD